MGCAGHGAWGTGDRAANTGKSATRKRLVQNQVSKAEGQLTREGGSETVLCNYHCGGRRKSKNRYVREGTARGWRFEEQEVLCLQHGHPREGDFLPEGGDGAEKGDRQLKKGLSAMQSSLNFYPMGTGGQLDIWEKRGHELFHKANSGGKVADGLRMGKKEKLEDQPGLCHGPGRENQECSAGR